MRDIPRLVTDIRVSYDREPELFRAILNAASWVEANLALFIGCSTVAERHLVAAVNMRETIRKLPRCPFAMAVDFETLAGVWGMEKVGGGWERACEDPGGDYTIVLVGEGNYCYDIAVKVDGTTFWLMSSDPRDLLNPDVVDLLIDRVSALPTIVDLTEAMGVPFSPLFYLSLDDWRHEYAEATFSEVIDMFNTSGGVHAVTPVASTQHRRIASTAV